MTTYEALTEETAVDFIRERTDLVGTIFKPGDTLRCKDLADGNVNLVFRVYAEQAPQERSVIVKQALPWARIVGPSFPMPLHRAEIEGALLEIEGRYCPEQTVKLHLYDPDMYINVLEDLNKHIIMRFGLMKQVIYPRFANDIGLFMARTLFYTSDLYLAHDTKKEMVAKHINPGLCKVTEDLVFTEPYIEHPNNKWNSELAPQVTEIRANDDLKGEIFVLKEAFMTHAEALIHGDLHTGSIMINEHETKVIDPEFAYFGPMGFDIGAVLGNLALSYCSQEYHAPDEAKRAAYRQWLLDVIRESWTVFETEFRRLWDQEEDKWPLPAFREKYLYRLLQDTAGFGGTKMMRRILGLAHVPDLESIPDPKVRAVPESMALNIGQNWIMNRHTVESIDDLITMIVETQSDYPYHGQ